MHDKMVLLESPDVESDVVICDKCNYEASPYFTELDADGCEVRAGAFLGTVEEALQQGWFQTDYGHLCPRCVRESELDINEFESVPLDTIETIAQDVATEATED